MGHQHAPWVGTELGLGNHVAFFFKNNEERLEVVIPYIVKGLQNHERCVYIVDENTVAEILGKLDEAGVDTRAAFASRALSVVTKDSSYLQHGIFEARKMIANMAQDVKFALKDGYSGLRVAGEMSWALDLPHTLSQLCEYEEGLCQHWPAQLAGLCQYNESLFPADVVEKIMAHHCIVLRDGIISRNHPDHKAVA